MSAVIRAEGLVKTYGRDLRAIAGVSLSVAPLGPSTATNSPGATESETPAIARRSRP